MIKKICPKISLRTFGLDLLKRWFFYIETIGGRKIKRYANINRGKTAEERLKIAASVETSLLKEFFNNGFQEAALLWLESGRVRWRKKTYQTFQSKIKIFFEWLAGRTLSAANIDLFFIHLENRHLTTRGEYLRLFSRLNKECWLVAGLLDNVQKIRSIKTPAKYFTKIQIAHLKAAILDKIPHTNLWLFVQFVYYCFIRPGELRLLKVEDIVLEEGKIALRGEISKNKKEQYVVIPAAFVAILEAALLGRVPSEYVFGGASPMSVNYFSSIHQKLLKSLNYDVGRYKLYSWKHTGVVAAARAGVHIKQLQIQLRHHSLDQVNDYLRQLGLSDLSDLSSKFPAI